MRIEYDLATNRLVEMPDAQVLPLTSEQILAEQKYLADMIDTQNAKADSVIQYLTTHTPAECAAYVSANVNNLATAVNILQKFAIALCVLSKEKLRV